MEDGDVAEMLLNWDQVVRFYLIYLVQWRISSETPGAIAPPSFPISIILGISFHIMRAWCGGKITCQFDCGREFDPLTHLFFLFFFIFLVY